MTRRQRPSSVALALALLVTGCAAPGSTGTSTPTTATATATVEPSASTTASPDATPDEGARPILEEEALATVRADGLDLRADGRAAAPMLDDSWGGKVRLNAGDHVLVLSSPTWADGMWWLEIATERHVFARFVPTGQVIVGFVAAGTRADPWVEEDNAWCPAADPSPATLAERFATLLTGLERLGCYGSTPFTFSAYAATQPPLDLGGECGEPPWPTYPTWLGCTVNYNWVNRDGGYAWEFLLHFDPATGIPPTGIAPEGPLNLLRITGHFDDPAAAACAPMPPTTREEVAAWLTCRTRFVVERVN